MEKVRKSCTVFLRSYREQMIECREKQSGAAGGSQKCQRCEVQDIHEGNSVEFCGQSETPKVCSEPFLICSGD